MAKCAICEGKGSLTCGQCKGKGDILGTGTLCNLCEGVGILRCEACDGKGLTRERIEETPIGKKPFIAPATNQPANSFL